MVICEILFSDMKEVLPSCCQNHQPYLLIYLKICFCVWQAERELQPWIAKDDDQGQKMWRINQRIVKLIVELMRNHDRPESLVILASASDLLLRATDGMLVDGEACTLPQLEVTSHNIWFMCLQFHDSTKLLATTFSFRIRSSPTSWSYCTCVSVFYLKDTHRTDSWFTKLRRVDSICILIYP